MDVRWYLDPARKGRDACHDLLALEVAGLRGRLYGGSWSEWSADPALPAETGGRS